MKNNQYCVIMAGGHLNRFWPISREGMPGHFLDISGTGKSLVRMAYERCLGVVPEENILIITLGKFKGIINEQIPELPKEISFWSLMRDVPHHVSPTPPTHC